jgi:transposase
VARQVGVVAQTVARWVSQYRREGKSGLKKAGRAGRKPVLDQQDRKRINTLLLEGTGPMDYQTPFWTCPRVAHLIEREFGVRYHPGHVWKLLIDLGWRLQLSRRRAWGRYQAQTLRWHKVLPIRKKPARKTTSSSSSTKAD